MSPEEQALLEWDWSFWARPKQLVPPDDEWRWLYAKCGRGFGKSRMGSEFVRERSENDPKSKLLLVGPTFQFVRELMIEDSDSGILACCPPWNRPEYYPSRLLLKWSNGALARGFGADKPDRIRGNNLTGAWLDEFCAWRRNRRKQSLIQVRLCLRKGRPKVLMTTTPKPDEDFKELCAKAEFDEERPELHDPVHHRMVHGSTYENEENLSETFRDEILDLEGTREGLQEIHGEVVDDTVGALFKMGSILQWTSHAAPPITYRVLAMDPAETSKPTSDNFGMVVVGRDDKGRGYVEEDLSAIMDPDTWAMKALLVAQDCDAIVAETNRGGEMIEHTLRLTCTCPAMIEKFGPAGCPMPHFIAVNASTSRRLRSQPVRTLYEQHRVYHVGYHRRLVNRMTQWVPSEGSESPGEICALVHGMLHCFPPRVIQPAKGSTQKPKGWA